MSLLPKKKKEVFTWPEPKTPGLVAKKNFKIVQNEFVREIKVGDDLSDLPTKYLENLKTEGVI